MKKALLVLFLAVASVAQGQVRIDSGFTFLAVPNKEYSLYIPSSYDAQTPNRMMVGFHPLNPAGWDAESWCDTLINFAETNGLILVCPDGGNDGAVDDPLDTAFTTALMDSMFNWYNIDVAKVYAMGFSVGGRATYTYGLNNPNKFGGFMPIGAAITGTNEVNGIIQNADGKPYYIVHGSLDAENIRFTPIRDALINNGAIVNTNLLQGVGHTIDFANRNQILTDGFLWLDSVNCAIQDSLVDGIEIGPNQAFGLKATGSNLLAPGQHFTGQINLNEAAVMEWRVVSITGQVMSLATQQFPAGETVIEVPMGDWPTGIYLIQLGTANYRTTVRVVLSE